MTEKASSEGHNRVSVDELRGLVERVERIREDKKALAADEKVIMAEAQAAGYSAAAIRYCIKRRTQSPSERQDEDALRDLYMDALGMGSGGPLFRVTAHLGKDQLARDQLVERMREVVPIEGEIIIKAGGEPVRIWRGKDGVAHEEVYVEPAPAPQTVTTGRRKMSEPTEPVPDCTEDEAEALGANAYHDDKPVIANPFPHDDARRPRWDQGWRAASGTDGMGPSED